MRRYKFTTTLSVAIVSLALSTALLRAQQVPVQQQQFNDNQQRRQLQDSQNLQMTTTNAPELYPGENEDVGPQHILRSKPRKTHFEVLLDTQFAYTDNNRLAHGSGTSTLYAVNTVQLAFAPDPMAMGPGIFAPRVGFRNQWYNYGLGIHGDEDGLNFDAETVFAGVDYQLFQHWEFDAELDYTRLLSQADYHQFYTEVMPTLSLSRIFQVQTNMLLTVGWQGAYHLSRVQSFPGSPAGVNDRLDNSLNATITWQVCGKLVLQPFYRFEAEHYPRTAFDNDRNDYFQTVGAAVSYYFTRQIAVRFFADEAFRTSDEPHTTSYAKFDSGLGASLDFRF